MRHAELERVAAWAADREGATLIGDLNTVPWSRVPLPDRAELVDSATTASAHLARPGRTAGVPIDHALHSRALTADRRNGPGLGSTHRAVVGTGGAGATLTRSCPVAGPDGA